MKNKNKKLVFFCLLIVFLPLIVFALEIDYPSFFGLTITNNSSIIEYAKYFFNLGMAIGGILALGAVAFGGLYYLMSFAGGKFTGEGREWVKAGVTGLAILLSSYLIVYTINPDLIYFRLEDLFPFLSRFGSQGITQKQIPIAYYNEIPLGVITENLVSRTRDCYDFDPEGNPIDGEKIKIKVGDDKNNKKEKDDKRDKTIGLPTYLDRDRVDCLLKLEDGVQKKTKIIRDLSNKIIELMEQCSCKDVGNCDTNPGASCSVDKYPNSEGACEGQSCTKVGCNGKNDCCPEGVKEKTEHGPIDIYDRIGGKKTYKGLDEFRTKLFTISSLVEFQVFAGGKTITLIDKIKWQNLKLVEQLMYFKEKIAQIKSEIEKDKEQLTEAKTAMAGCSTFIKSSVDLLERKEETIQNKKTVQVNKIFSDNFTRGPVEPYKYCRGFNYSNSSCYKTCGDKCPDTSPEVISCYAKCDGKCKEGDKNCKECKEGDENCLNEKQQKCVEKCYNERPCPLSSDRRRDSDFEHCAAFCQDNCYDGCSERYLPSSDQFKICQNQCQKNSQCVLDNKEKCLISGESFQGCAAENINNDYGNIENCIDNAYLCKYGSDEYAGYPECLKDDDSSSPYSSPFLFKNQSVLRCPNPYIEAAEEETTALCYETFPETLKCPPASKCPECPCGSVVETLVFSEDPDCPQGECLGPDGCSPGNCDDKKEEGLSPFSFYTVYAHMDKINVSVGQKVNEGDIIGELGEIGTDTGPHIHFAAGVENPAGNSIYDIATSFDIYSSVSAPGGSVGSRVPGTFPVPLPPTATKEQINFILKSLTAPVSISHCQWYEEFRSYLHNYNAYWAQDWRCPQDSETENAKAMVMAGSVDIKSTVINIISKSGAVVIKHDYQGDEQITNPVIEEYVLVTAECQEFAFNNDPLTFYCPVKWEPEAHVSGKWSVASLGDEIPVGRTVDDSLAWTDDLLKKISGFQNLIDETIRHMKKIGDKKDKKPEKDNSYCTCDSKYDADDDDNKKDGKAGKPICTNDCEFFQDEVPAYDKNGNPILEIQCFCSVTPCDGNPCEQMIDWLLKIRGFYNEIRKTFIDFYSYFIVSEKRTDVLKELTYSRKKMTDCSKEVVQIGEEITKTLNCTQAYGNSFLGDKRCYGILEGKVTGKNLTDNWFCGKEALK